MTRPRTSTTRELYGILGSFDGAGALQAAWNAHFSHEGMDAFMDRYPTKVGELPERLSEMFHFDRRAYILGSSLQEAVIPLLDSLDPTAKGEGRVDTVVNKGGVMTGYFLESSAKDPQKFMYMTGF